MFKRWTVRTVIDRKQPQEGKSAHLVCMVNLIDIEQSQMVQAYVNKISGSMASFYRLYPEKRAKTKIAKDVQK